MGQPKRGRSGHTPDWELELIEVTALRIDTTERAELRAELARHWLCLKTRPPPGIRNWKAFLTTALRNKALNWARDQQTRNKHFLSLDRTTDPDDESVPWIENIPSTAPEPDLEHQSAMDAIDKELKPELKVLLEALLATDGNQTRAAELMGKHRNTVRAGIRKIQEFLGTRGFRPSDLHTAYEAPKSGPRAESVLTAKRPARIAISTSLVGLWITKRLSGTQWRILLWVILECARRKQGAVRFRWADFARELSLHRVGVLRAGAGLIRKRILHAENGTLRILKA